MVTFYLLCLQVLLLNNDGKLELQLCSAEALYLDYFSVAVSRNFEMYLNSNPEQVHRRFQCSSSPPFKIHNKAKYKAVPFVKSCNAKCRISREYRVSVVENNHIALCHQSFNEVRQNLSLYFIIK